MTVLRFPKIDETMPFDKELDIRTIREGYYSDEIQSLIAGYYHVTDERLRIRCMCSKASPKFTVKKRHASGHYYISRMPNTAKMHDATCIFREVSELGKGSRAVPAIEETDDGFLVALDVILKKKGAQKKGGRRSAVAMAKRSSGDKREKAKLWDLLAFLWDRAGVNVWWPKMAGKRSYPKVRYWVEKAMEGGKLGGSNIKEIMFFLPWFPSKDFEDQPWFEKRRSEYFNGIGLFHLGLVMRGRVIMVAKVRDMVSSSEGRYFVCQSIKGKFWIEDEGLADLFRVVPSGSDTFLIAVVEMEDDEDEYRVVHGDLFNVSRREFIPVNTQQDIQVVRDKVDNQVAFEAVMQGYRDIDYQDISSFSR